MRALECFASSIKMSDEIVVPCYRVIAQKGLDGYNSGIEIKKISWSVKGADR